MDILLEESHGCAWKCGNAMGGLFSFEVTTTYCIPKMSIPPLAILVRSVRFPLQAFELLRFFAGFQPGD